MKTVYYLVLKDIIRFKTDKRAVVLTFIVPMVMIIIFGYIFGGSGPRGKVNMIFVNNSNSVVARMLEQKLDTSKTLFLIKTYTPEPGNEPVKIDEEKAKELIISGKSSSAALVLPKDFFADTSSALKFKFYYDPKNDIESGLIQSAVQQTIFRELPRLFPVLMKRKAAKYLGQDSSNQFIKGFGNIVSKYFHVPVDSFMKSVTTVDSASLTSTFNDTSDVNSPISNMIKFDSEQLVGKEISNPGLTRTVGGWAVMFLLFSLTGASTSLFEERSEGTLKRLLCMPIKRTHILWSKSIYTMLLGFFLAVIQS